MVLLLTKPAPSREIILWVMKPNRDHWKVVIDENENDFLDRDEVEMYCRLIRRQSVRARDIVYDIVFLLGRHLSDNQCLYY